nr:[protein-PII] uridylyltransferase [Stenotrophomonas sp. MMGLT7]
MRARTVDRIIRSAWQRCLVSRQRSNAGPALALDPHRGVAGLARTAGPGGGLRLAPRADGDAHDRHSNADATPASIPMALFAVGGYGRGELFPCSDIDLLVLAEGTAQQAGEAGLARLFALLWDAGLPVSHAVRSPAQCTVAAEDQTVLTALIEARALVADAEAVQRLRDAVSPARVWPARAFFLAKREELTARHQRFGDTADNLEPDLKDGPGGLRDLNTLGWMALRTFGVSELGRLVGLGHLGPDEAAALVRERRRLAQLRFGLHLVAGRPEERLRFDYQKALAQRLGYGDDPESLGVEKMMQGFYRSAAVVRRISDRLLQRFEEQFDGEAAPEPLEQGYSLRRGYLSADGEGWPKGDPLQVFALFAVWAGQSQGRGLHSLTARALAEALPRLPAYAYAGAAARERFMALLRAPRAVETLNRMARLGVLAQWIPAFAKVSGRMQFDLFHVYTVDQHTLMVLRNIALFATSRADERFSIAHEIWPRLRKPELLLLAGLFHDIAKGRGGDHSLLGAVDAREFCAAHGLSATDTDLVAWLVEQHLRMSVTAQKQDIADPGVIHAFATLVATRERLDYLYLLTCADIAGTSPKLWNAWKDRLLADLYFATRRALREGLEHPPPLAERLAEARDSARTLLHVHGFDDATIERQFAGMPIEGFLRFRPEQLAWQAAALTEVAIGQTLVKVRPVTPGDDALEVFVYSPDRDGLFAAIVMTLDRKGYRIHRARVLDAPHGSIFDTFEVSPAESYAAQPRQLQEALYEALSGDLERLRPSRRVMPRQLRHFRFAPRVELRPTVDGQRTRLSLVAPDRPGLLADVAQVLRGQRLRVHDARIATFGERAEDQFQITDEHDQPLPETSSQALREALLACLDPDRKPGETP